MVSSPTLLSKADTNAHAPTPTLFMAWLLGDRVLLSLTCTILSRPGIKKANKPSGAEWGEVHSRVEQGQFPPCNSVREVSATCAENVGAVVAPRIHAVRL